MSLLLGPDGSEPVLICNAVAVDQFEPIALTDELVEGGLVLRGRQAMTGLPGRCIRYLTEDGGVAILRSVVITADNDRLVALRGDGIEECLVFSCRQAVTSLPGRRALYLAPDGRVKVLAAIEIAA